MATSSSTDPVYVVGPDFIETLSSNDAGPSTPSTESIDISWPSNDEDDSTLVSSRHRSLPENSPNSDADMFLDSWDFVIHRCTECNRPFGTSGRLLQHQQQVHVSTSTPLPVYELLNIKFGNEEPVPGTEIIDIVPNGDLVLVFEDGFETATHDVRVRVASQVLRIASQVFDNMFSTASICTEALMIRRAALDPTRPALIRLDDDVTAAVEVMLILHQKHLDIRPPKKVSFDLLLKITEFADKYQLAPAIRPTVLKWLDIYAWGPRAIFNSTTPKRGHEDALAVCWLFLDSAQFEGITQELSLRAQVSDGTLYFGPSGKPRALPDFLPAVVIGKLFDLRAQHIDPIRSEFQTLQARRTYKSTILEPICSVRVDMDEKYGLGDLDLSTPHQLLCDALQLGHLMQMTALHQLDKDTFWNQSVRKIMATFKELKPARFSQLHSSLAGHDGCEWVTGLEEVAKGCNKKNMKLGLRFDDFPCRQKTGSQRVTRRRVL